MHTPLADSNSRAGLLIASWTWLAAGSVLLLTTLVPAHTDFLGWSPMFWLLWAPLAVTLTLEPSWPRRLLTRRRSRRRHATHVIWN